MGPREATADIAERHGAKMAVNGDAYGFHNNAIIVRNGEILRAKRTNTYHLLMLDGKGDLSVASATQFGKKADPRRLAEEMLEAGVSDVWCFGPALVRDGEAASFKGFEMLGSRTKYRAPRTAIGQIGPLHYVMVVVDGRKPRYSAGINLPDLQQIFLDLGAQTAFNLDGGGSTALYFCGEVISVPSDVPERAVSDILYFK
jgi:exopolysaccharide biosynthesis protein